MGALASQATVPLGFVLQHSFQNRSEANILTHVSYFRLQRDKLKASADDKNQTFQVCWIILTDFKVFALFCSKVIMFLGFKDTNPNFLVKFEGKIIFGSIVSTAFCNGNKKRFFLFKYSGLIFEVCISSSTKILHCNTAIWQCTVSTSHNFVFFFLHSYHYFVRSTDWVRNQNSTGKVSILNYSNRFW